MLRIMQLDNSTSLDDVIEKSSSSFEQLTNAVNNTTAIEHRKNLFISLFIKIVTYNPCCINFNLPYTTYLGKFVMRS